ncbi:MAG TPA: acyl-CoA ligase (AMP-forming), exosortase A system-associated [Burkholderiaceae bacterium]|jgi:acyl-CoA ligase (AMP-forming) (exosortase A-associated)
MPTLVHELIFTSAQRTPTAEALCYQAQHLDYAMLAKQVKAIASGLLNLNLQPSERVAVYLEKRVETVAALFGASAAGAVFVPINPLLKPEQVAYIMSDCNVKILVTSTDRLAFLADVLSHCPDLHTIIVIDADSESSIIGNLKIVPWHDATNSATTISPHKCIDTDIAAILYTSGSTGKPKGVVLSHRNLIVGAESVSTYLENTADDRLLAVLPLSFDYGLSQLTTAFHVGAAAVLMNHLFPRDIVNAVSEQRITGLAAVPPLWIQLAQLPWPENASLRYLTNSGGAMPRPTLDALRRVLPSAKVFLMYGLTEAFRSTYLPPSQLDKRPDSIGRAIPHAEILVMRPDGTPCAVNEPGELVHRGALVSLGYWNDPDRTAERFKPVHEQNAATPTAELAVWSGDTVRKDEEGFLYFIGRNDDMIKVSGYRVSPTEVEEVLHATGMVSEVAAFGVTHPTLGQTIAVVACPTAGYADIDKLPHALLKQCQQQLPAYMVPAHIKMQHENLPRNPNGKIDRKALQLALASQFDATSKI